MEKIKAIVVDDEQDGRIVLEYHLEKNCSSIELLGSFSNSDDAISFLKSNPTNLLFLDINMPEKDGFDLLEELGNYECHIIFVTAYEEYAIRAIKYSAFDYLLKPIDPDELKKSVDRLQRTTYDKKKTELLIHNLKEETPAQIALPSSDGYSFLDIDQIIRCEADSNYCNIYLGNGKKHIATKTLKKIQEILPEEIFFRVHKSHIINMNYVKEYKKSDGGMAILKNDIEVEVSRRNKADFLERMKMFST